MSEIHIHHRDNDTIESAMRSLGGGSNGCPRFVSLDLRFIEKDRGIKTRIVLFLRDEEQAEEFARAIAEAVGLQIVDSTAANLKPEGAALAS